MIESGGGWIAVALALGAVGSAWKKRESPDRNWVLVALGALVVALAVYHGTGERLDLTAYATEKTVQGDPGIGVYVLGVGGLLIAAAGLREFER